MTSERVNLLTPNAELFYRRILSVVDDFGRYSANATLLRAHCYPLKLDSVKEDSIKKHLAECVDAGLIVLYTVESKGDFLEVLYFGQQIRATKSKYPQPPDKCVANATQKTGRCSADARQLIADAHLVVSVSEDVVKEGASPDGDAPARNGQGAIPYQGIADLYNRLLLKLPKVRELTAKRKTMIRLAWQASADRQTLGFWRAFFEECADDPFLNGTGPYGNGHANWRPTFDYLLRAEVITRVYEAGLDRADRQREKPAGGSVAAHSAAELAQ